MNMVLSSESRVVAGCFVTLNMAALVPLTVAFSPVREKPPLLRTVKVVSTDTPWPRVPRSKLAPLLRSVFTGCSTTISAAVSE